MSKLAYTLVYHTSISFRIAPIQMLLLDAGIPYTMAAPEWDPEKPQKWRVVNPKDNPGMPVFAPPVLRQGDFTLSQTMAIMNYLAGAHGYDLRTPQENASMLQVLLDVGDIGGELFAIAKDAGKKKSFTEERLPNWLNHLERAYQHKNKSEDTKNGNFIFPGERPSAVDFALCSLLESLDFTLSSAKVKELLPSGLTLWRQAFQTRPFFQAYQAQAQPQLFESMKFVEEGTC